MMRLLRWESNSTPCGKGQSPKPLVSQFFCLILLPLPAVATPYSTHRLLPKNDSSCHPNLSPPATSLFKLSRSHTSCFFLLLLSGSFFLLFMEYRSTPTACNSPIRLSHLLLEINAPASSASDSYSSSSDSDDYRIEQDLLWRKEKSSICLPWLSHMMTFLLKIQLEELDRVEVAKKLEVERHLKFFHGNITAAFADLDNAIMEVGRSNHRCQQSTRPCHWYNEFRCC